MPNPTLDLLNKVMEGNLVDPSDIDDLLAHQISEDQFLDYKHGTILSQRRPCKVIREYLTGFANAEGGVLLIGVDGGTWTVTGATAPGGHPLDEWAKSCISDLAGHFAPLPRFQSVNHPNGDVLVAATARSINLVPDVQGRQLRYYLRIHDSTVKVPEYLLADLMLGRRQHPVLRIADYHFLSIALSRPEPDYIFQFGLTFHVENKSLAWAEDIRLGLIAQNHGQLRDPLRSRHLLASIDREPIDDSRFPYLNYLSHIEKEDRSNVHGPYAVSDLQLPRNSLSLPLSQHGQFCLPYTWRAAVYVVSRDSPPFWYQLDMTINNSLLNLLTSADRAALNEDKATYLQVLPVQTDRPVVAWSARP